MDLIKENDLTLKKQNKKKAKTDDILQKLLPDHMIKCILQIYLPKPNPYYKAARGIVLHVNAIKTECICFKQERAISTLNGMPLKLVDKFIYHGSNISSTESDLNICLTKAWTAIDRLSIMWKADIFDRIKQEFSKLLLCHYYWMDAPHGRK